MEHIIQQFKEKVLDHMDEFRQQIVNFRLICCSFLSLLPTQIHGDFNEQNILTGKKPGKNDYTVIGFLDFGDTQYSCLVFEIALAMTYMLLTSGDIRTGGYFLSGYKMIRLIPDNEMKVLKVLVDRLTEANYFYNHFFCSCVSVLGFAKA